MALVSLDIPVPNAAELAATYDRIVVFRSLTGARGSFTELTTPATRLPLTAQRLDYSYRDAGGMPGYYYATAFTSTKTGGLSPISAPVQPGGDPALSLLSVADLKQLAFFGIPLGAADGTTLPDSLLAFYIKTAVRYVERSLDMALTPRIITGEQHPYLQPRVATKPMLFQLQVLPVQSLQQVRFIAPGMSQATVLDPRFCTVNRQDGLVTVYAGGIFGLQRAFDSGLLFNPAYNTECLNDGMEIDYVAGFPMGQLDAEIQELLLMAASVAPFGILKDQVIAPGVGFTNISGDGFGESISATNAFDARISGYKRDLDNRLADLRFYYHGVSIVGT